MRGSFEVQLGVLDLEGGGDGVGASLKLFYGSHQE